MKDYATPERETRAEVLCDPVISAYDEARNELMTLWAERERTGTVPMYDYEARADHLSEVEHREYQDWLDRSYSEVTHGR